MASQDHIRNPIEWGWDQITLATLTVGSLGRSLGGSEESRNAPLPAICRIKVSNLRDALVGGLDDLGAYRTDVIFPLHHLPARRHCASMADFRP
jgi:hypothetical protein